MAGTVADLLVLMADLDAEIETAASEVDEAPSIRLLTQAQHYFETLCATYPRAFQTVTTAVTVANTETTTWTSGLLRFDKMQLLDSSGRVVRDIESLDDIGSHAPSLPWPLQISAVGATGEPFAFYGNMANFYWLPLPSAVSTVRVYGLIEQARFAARADVVFYPYRVHLALAQFANKLSSLSVGDDTGDLDRLAAQVFGPILKQLKKFDRSHPRGRYYHRLHTT